MGKGIEHIGRGEKKYSAVVPLHIVNELLVQIDLIVKGPSNGRNYQFWGNFFKQLKHPLLGVIKTIEVLIIAKSFIGIIGAYRFVVGT